MELRQTPAPPYGRRIHNRLVSFVLVWLLPALLVVGCSYLAAART